jgi:hypothetical protein
MIPQRDALAPSAMLNQCTMNGSGDPQHSEFFSWPYANASYFAGNNPAQTGA